MKFKKSTIKTAEGLSLANYSDGWSMEYGEGGSYTCDILVDGKKAATVIEEGNGGPVMVHYEGRDHSSVDDKVLAFLKRTNKDYGPDSKYDFCKNATKAGDTEYAMFVNDMLDVVEFSKHAKSAFKKGYKSIMEINVGCQCHTIKGGRYDDYEGLVSYAKKQGINADEADKIHFLVEGQEITLI